MRDGQDKDELIRMLTEIVIRQNRVIASLQRQQKKFEEYARRLERMKIEEFLSERRLIDNRDVV